MRFISITLFLVLTAAPQPVAAQLGVLQEPEANPGRPTVSTPATLTPVGYLQFETGFLAAYHSPEFSSRYSLNEVVKLSIAPRLQLLTLAEPIVHFTADRTTAKRVGDIFWARKAWCTTGKEQSRRWL